MGVPRTLASDFGAELDGEEGEDEEPLDPQPVNKSVSAVVAANTTACTGRALRAMVILLGVGFLVRELGMCG